MSLRIPRWGLNCSCSVGAAAAGAIALAALPSPISSNDPFGAPSPIVNTPYVALGFNDMGLHFMTADFEDIMLFPPSNTLHAQVLRRQSEPSVITTGITVRYFIPNHTHAAALSNFWDNPVTLLGNPAPNIGVTGHGLSGTMTATPSRDWSVTGIPLVPIDDNGREDPYPLAVIEVIRNGSLVARTLAVVPASSELGCSTCHFREGKSTAEAILTAHDELHGTTLLAQRPVACANCHADNALGAPGVAGVPPLSISMHAAHATRVPQPDSTSACYFCHPGIRTNSQRDLHVANGVTCTNCHGGMEALGTATRRPWLDLPHCYDCHTRANFEFELNGALFRDATGHGGVHCAACHGSPHAMGPATTERDNAQAVTLQGHAGRIDTCTVCHTSQPQEAFWHRHSED